MARQETASLSGGMAGADYDELWAGGPRFVRPGEGYKLSTDSVLLAHFTKTVGAKRIMDLGSGAGALTVLLAAKSPGADIEGVEIQSEAAEQSLANIFINSLDGRCGITCADLRDYRSLFIAGAYDLVVSNPPYFALGGGGQSPDPSRAAARDERMCTLEQLCSCAAFLCRWGGAFSIVYRPERLAQAICEMTGHGLEPKRLRMVQHKPDSAPSLVLIEAGRGAKPGLIVEKPLILRNADGLESDESREIYHRREGA